MHQPRDVRLPEAARGQTPGAKAPVGPASRLASRRFVRRLLAASFAALLACKGFAGIARARAPTDPGAGVPSATGSAPMPPGGKGDVALGTVALVIVLFVLIGALARLAVAMGRREAEALALEARLSDVLRREHRLLHLPAMPTARVRAWWDSPPTIEVFAHVPVPELRERILRVVEHEAHRVCPDVRIEDRIAVLPALAPRTA